MVILVVLHYYGLCQSSYLGDEYLMGVFGEVTKHAHCKYNFRMQWLQTIQSCMRKVRSKVLSRNFFLGGT